MATSVSILAEIPEDLHYSLKNYLESHPNWDQDQVFTVALSLFLLQNEGSSTTRETSQSYCTCAKVYLEAVFQCSDN